MLGGSGGNLCPRAATPTWRSLKTACTSAAKCMSQRRVIKVEAKKEPLLMATKAAAPGNWQGSVL